MCLHFKCIVYLNTISRPVYEFSALSDYVCHEKNEMLSSLSIDVFLSIYVSQSYTNLINGEKRTRYRERQRERAIQRETERESVCVSVSVCASVCVCVCVLAKEGRLYSYDSNKNRLDSCLCLYPGPCMLYMHININNKEIRHGTKSCNAPVISDN